jgi:hypothetical protein
MGWVTGSTIFRFKTTRYQSGSGAKGLLEGRIKKEEGLNEQNSY